MPGSDLVSRLQAGAALALSSPIEMLAVVSVVVAGALVIVSSFVKTMIPLRWLAIGSNFGFVIYGALQPSLPMLLLHATLVPINAVRLLQMIRLTRHVSALETPRDLSGVWLRPYMRARRFRRGAVLFRKGDRADRLYFLAEGTIEFVEIGEKLPAGQMFGEIAFFAPDRRRRLTARCLEPCNVLSIDGATVKQLYAQNPAFGFELVRLVAGRLSADVIRLQDELANATASSSGAPETAN